MNTLHGPDSRHDRLSRLLTRSIDPYPPNFERTHRSSEVADGPKRVDSDARIAGWVQECDSTRLVVEDGSAQIEIVISRELLDAQRQLLELLDPGDVVGVGVHHDSTANLFTATSLAVLSKGLAPRPDLTQ